MNCLNHLPSELQREIFGYLSPMGDLARAATISKRTNNTVKQIWKKHEKLLKQRLDTEIKSQKDYTIFVKNMKRSIRRYPEEQMPKEALTMSLELGSKPEEVLKFHTFMKSRDTIVAWEKIARKINIILSFSPAFESMEATLRQAEAFPNWMQEHQGAISQITTFYLFYNHFVSLPANFFIFLPQLQIVNLLLNQFTSIPSKTFVDCLQLRFVYLSNNRLTSLAPNTFTNCPQLIEVTLSNNDLTFLEPNAFTNCPQLIKVNLSNNDLTSLEPNAFINCPRLQVDISDNPLNSIPRQGNLIDMTGL